MRKIMFDSNAYDLLIPVMKPILKEYRESSHNECSHTYSGESVITIEQANEIASLPDEEKEKRAQEFIRICRRRPYLDGGLTSFFEKTTDLYEYYVCSMQLVELATIPDISKDNRNTKKTRIYDFLILCSMRPRFVSAMGTADRYRLDVDHLASQNDTRIFSGITTEDGNHAKDAIIAAAADDGEMIVVTDDDKFKKRLTKFNIKYMTNSDWLDSVSIFL